MRPDQLCDKALDGMTFTVSQSLVLGELQLVLELVNLQGSGFTTNQACKKKGARQTHEPECIIRKINQRLILSTLVNDRNQRLLARIYVGYSPI